MRNDGSMHKLFLFGFVLYPGCLKAGATIRHKTNKYPEEYINFHSKYFTPVDESEF